MASVHRRPKSPYWHCAFRSPDGVLFLRSTKLRDRKKALLYALEAERAAKLAGEGVLVETAARKIVQDIMEKAHCDEVLRCPSVREFLEEWMVSKKTVKAAGTSARYGKAVSEFLKHLGDRAEKPLSNLTSRMVQGFVTKRSALGLKGATVSLDAKVIRTALSRARRQGLILSNPAEAVDLPANNSMERVPFSPSEVKLLVDTAEGEWKTLIQLAYFCGARMGDCTRMEWDSVDFTRGTLSYTQRKTGRNVIVPLHPELEKHLESLAGDKPEQFIMPGMATKGPGGQHGLSEGFKALMRKAGVDCQRVNDVVGVRTLSRRTFHSLRHSFTSALANADVSPELRMKLTGHSTEASHKVYTHHELETLRRAIDKLPELK